MDLNHIELGILQTNCYVIGGEDGLVIIDPGYCPPELISLIEDDGRKPEAILLTHGHFDHTMGVDQLREHFDIPVRALIQEKQTLETTEYNLSTMFSGQGVLLESPVSYFSEGEVLTYAGLKFETIWVPGHSQGGCCYYVRDEEVLFSGDSLFCGSVGRTDLAGGDMTTLVENLREKVMTLPDKTAVCPGHGPGTDIAFEKQFNMFVR